MSNTPYIVLEKLGEGTYATVHKVSARFHMVSVIRQPGEGKACKNAATCYIGGSYLPRERFCCGTGLTADPAGL